MRRDYDWKPLENWAREKYVCGHCGTHTTSVIGWQGNLTFDSHLQQVPSPRRVFVCTNCMRVTYWEHRAGGPVQWPPPLLGEPISLPELIAPLYTEARKACSHGMPYSCVLVCRTLLQKVASDLPNAPKDMTFVGALDHIMASGYITPQIRSWVEHIRKEGNKVTHETFAPRDAREILDRTEMLLKLIYDYAKRAT